MAQKGEYKPPIESSYAAYLRAMALLDEVNCGFALYMVSGRVRCSRESSHGYHMRVNKFKDALIGVYTEDVDTRLIKQDIDAYYEIFNQDQSA